MAKAVTAAVAVVAAVMDAVEVAWLFLKGTLDTAI